MTRISIADLANQGAITYSDGYRTKRSELDADGYRILRVADIANGSVTLTSPDFVARSKTAAIGVKAGQAGDILLTTKGTVGRVAILEEGCGDVVYSPQICFFRVNSATELNSMYLYYWFQSPDFRHQSQLRKGNTDMADYINLRDIASLELDLPTIAQQADVVGILSSIDNYINSLRRIQNTLLELAGSYYRQSIAIDSTESTVDSVATFLNSKRKPLSAAERNLMKGSIPYYGATGSFDTVNEYLFDRILVLVGEDGSVVRPNGAPVAQYIWGRSWINNHAHVLVGALMSTEALFIALSGADVRALVTGAVQPKISMGNLRRLPIKVPAPSHHQALEDVLQKIFKLYRSNKESIYAAESLRDALLAPLMSGTISVRETEQHLKGNQA